MKRRILLYKNGVTDPRLVPSIGDYETWFGRILDGVHLEIHLGYETPHHPLTGYDGLLLTGSPRSLAEPEPWMDEAAAFVRRAADAGVPVLGVCFGHQLLGHAYGGRVRVNPRGWEVGTVDVALTEEGRADRLFSGLPPRLRVNQSHRDEVFELGETRALATSPHTATQALAVGEHVRGVQFHPEMDAAVIRRLIAHRREILVAGGIGVEERHESARDTPDGERVLRNWVTEFVARR